jgi:hypothetical protein
MIISGYICKLNGNKANMMTQFLELVEVLIPWKKDSICNHYCKIVEEIVLKEI